MARQKLINALAEVEQPPPVNVSVDNEHVLIIVGKPPREFVLGFSPADALDFAADIRNRALILQKRGMG